MSALMPLFRFALPITAVAMYLISIPSRAAAQNLSIGVLAGGSLTDGFSAESSPGNIHFLSTSRDYLIGPAIQWRFSPSWLVEADGLFRELHLGRAATQPNGTLGRVSPAPVVTWEFPVLAKYELTSWRPRPLVEVGPSFRTAGNLNGANPSHSGLTAGVGIELRAKALTFSPVLRYTRWMKDNPGDGYQPTSNPNQLELAMAVSASPESNTHPMSSRMSAGILVGVGLTDDLRTTQFGFISGTQSFNSVNSPKRGVLTGPAIEFALPASVSLEIDAVYAPLRSTTVTAVNGGNSRLYSTSIGNWDLPVLAKRRFRMRLANPFIEAGPAFRIGTGQLSHFGITAGLGLEAHAGRFKVAPTVRYSHWAVNPYEQGIGNQLELFAAFIL